MDDAIGLVFFFFFSSYVVFAFALDGSNLFTMEEKCLWVFYLLFFFIANTCMVFGDKRNTLDEHDCSGGDDFICTGNKKLF